MKILGTMVVVVVGFSQTVSAEIKDITVVSDIWDNATEESGRGLYWDILRLVYEDEGIRLKHQSMRYSRSVKMVKTGKADAWLGASLNEVVGMVYPRLAIDVDENYVLYKRNMVTRWQGQKTIEGKKVGWIRGYNFDQNLDVKVEIHEFLSSKVGLSRLKNGKLEFILDAKYDLEQAIQEYDFDTSDYEMKKVMSLPIYLTFANNDHGKHLAQLYDKRLEELIKDGQIKALFEKYQWPTYPF